MSSDIKNEFEEYVKTLTETICNDIFLEKLEQICHEYEDGVKPCLLYTSGGWMQISKRHCRGKCEKRI